MQASSAADPGVTGSSILIGGTVPLSGEASSGGLTAKGADAFFKSTNAHKGVFNRKINYDYKDDAYDPAKTIQATRELVQQDHVFAIFNPLGTAQNIATRPFLNSLGVPQLFVASGWGGWARDAKQFPLTIGVIPTYTGEAIVYGRYIKAKIKGAKIGVLYQDDEYGRELLNGLKKGLGSKQSMIVSQKSYDPTSTDVSSQISQLKASGANVVMIFAFGKFAIQSFVYIKKLGWKPKQVFVNAVAAATSVMQLASTSGQTEGAISIAFFKDPAEPGLRQGQGDEALQVDHAEVRKRWEAGPGVEVQGERPAELVQRVLPGRDGLGLGDGRRAQGGGQEPLAQEPDEGRPPPEHQEQPVRASGDQDQDLPERPLADRTGADGALARRALAPLREARHRPAEVSPSQAGHPG